MDSLQTFKSWCYDSFSFLKEYKFFEEPLPKKEHTNLYQVIFSNGTIKIKILGEGYGTAASVLFITRDNEEVYYSQLSKQSSPAPKNGKKKQLSQKEQIFFAADYIKNNLQRTLAGDYSKLLTTAAQIAKTRLKLKEDFINFLNDPEARAERAARVAVTEAGHAFKSKDYKKVVGLLEPHIKYLASKQIERLAFARSNV